MVSANMLCVLLTFIRYYYHDSQKSTTKRSVYRTHMFAGTNTNLVYCVSDLIKRKSMFIPRIMGLLFV